MYNNDVEADIQDQMMWTEKYQEGISQGLSPGRYLAEFLPFLRYLPRWFLGPELRTKSPEWRSAAKSLKEIGVARVQEALVSHDDGRSSEIN